MIALVVLAAAVAIVVALVVPGQSGLLVLAGPCLVAGLWLWWRRRIPQRPAPSAAKGRYVIVDGSNVLHWNAGTPQLETVVAVLAELARRGLTAGVMFDATVGYRIGDRYQDDAELAHRLGLPVDRVLVMPKGSPADRTILEAARRFGAQVVTNDRYRDWETDFPEVAAPGLLVRGGVRNGKVWLKGLSGAVPQALEAAGDGA